MRDGAQGSVRVEVIYAERGAAHRFELCVPEGSSIADVILGCSDLGRIPALKQLLGALAGRGAIAPQLTHGIGVFGERRDPSDRVCAGDRIEIYRALSADPKLARRRRAAHSG
jgi:putative ubiquitin-RnfH superfamily antitoxin RatB of RatAB toxin-antitoxin module